MKTWPLILSLFVVFPGCIHVDEWRQSSANRERASQAWKFAPERCTGDSISRDYASGWQEGYFDVANGGTGQVPIVPPRRYWSTKFQNNAGQQQIADWFAGYRTGAGAALAANAGGWNVVPTSLEEADVQSSVQVQQPQVPLSPAPDSVSAPSPASH